MSRESDGAVRGDPRAIDGPWMTEALERAGIARGAKVTSVELVGFIGTGQMARNARLALTWDDPDGRPETLVGKFPTDDPPTLAQSFENGAYLKEFLFYDELVHTVRVRTPACWVRRYDATGRAFVLLMEDLADSAAGNQFTECTPDETALAVEQAVALHGPRWGDPTLREVPAFADVDDASDRLAVFYAALVPAYLDRHGHRLDDDVIGLVRDFGDVIRAWPHASHTPRTIVHGDFRPDNFLFGQTPSAPPLAIVDWQTASLGVGITDLAYLLGGALSPASREAAERDLVEEYRGRLTAMGIDYGADDCWRDYRLGTLHGVLIAVFANSMAEQTARGDDLFTLMGTRHARHALDLDALALLR